MRIQLVATNQEVLITSVPEKGPEFCGIIAAHTRALKEPTGLQLVKGTV
jgi:hypothetical protein